MNSVTKTSLKFFWAALWRGLSLCIDIKREIIFLMNLRPVLAIEFIKKLHANLQVTLIDYCYFLNLYFETYLRFLTEVDSSNDTANLRPSLTY